MSTKVTERFASMSDLIEQQDSLNKIINKQWRNIGHKDALTPAHFQTEMLIEATKEMIDDSGVEHAWWKQVEVDFFDEFNFKVEIIDILHFYVSQYILVLVERNDNKLELNETHDEMFFGSDVTSIFNKDFDLESFPTLLTDTNKLNHEMFMESIRGLVSLDVMSKDVNEDIIFTRLAYGLFNGFVTLARMGGQELSAIFYAKMELNRFRQSSGYKSGKYAKVVDGIEDNQRLKVIVDEFLSDNSKTLAWVRKQTRDTFFRLTQ